MCATMNQTESAADSFETTINSESDMLRFSKAAWKLGRVPQLCVIGAGVAGLRCAEILRKEGADVTLVEARNRVGGRTHQVQLGQEYVDMGPNWIHGTDGNPMVDLAEHTGTTTSSLSEEVLVRDEHGYPFQDESRSASLSEMLWSIIADAFKYAHETPSIPARKSLRDFFVEKLEAKDVTEEDRVVLLQMAEQWGHFVGSPVSRQSLKYFWLEESLEGENLFVAGTYRKILQEISSRAIANEDQVKLSTKVHSIKTVTNISPDADIKVELSMESEHSGKHLEHFDAAILTVSLGCLKTSKPSIEPRLNQRIQAAIHNLGYGNLEKAYITFPKPFWSGEKDPHSFASFVNFLKPDYDPENNPTRELIDCMPLSSLAGGSGQPTLLFYFSGEYAQRLVKSFSELATGSPEYVEAICKAFQPYYSRLPHYDVTSPACKPVAAVATAWSVDDLAGCGSYTNFQIPGPEDDTTAALDEDIRTLRKGMPEQGLWIAGEHTAPFAALGTITGAYWSGEKVARRVVSWFRGDGDPIDAEVGEKGS